MKRLAWILGLLALGATLFTGWSMVHARREMRRAVIAQGKFAENAAIAEENTRIQDRTNRIHVDTDRIKVHNDEMLLEIARLQGKSTAAAQANLSIDRQIEMSDEQLVSLSDTFGNGDPAAAEAHEREQACALSAKVYAAIFARDTGFAYATGVLWLAFGFAAALSPKRAPAPA